MPNFGITRIDLRNKTLKSLTDQPWWADNGDPDQRSFLLGANFERLKGFQYLRQRCHRLAFILKYCPEQSAAEPVSDLSIGGSLLNNR